MPISDYFYTRYIQLESRVREIMIQSFSETCGMCTACCCRADICEEVGESAFLSNLLKRQGINTDDMDERFGWLDLQGCSLEYGRPPVCYAYYCDELLSRLPDDEARHASSILGKLVLHIGQNALGGWHLTEIMDTHDLEKVDAHSLDHRLEEAEAALQVLEAYIHTGRLNQSDRETLAIITTEEP